MGAILGLCGLVLVAGFIEISTPGGMDEDSVVAIAIGLLLFCFLGLMLLALGLGIGGLTASDSRPLFAILGTIVSSVGCLFTLLLLLVGLAAE